jgi:hypothetical protein
METAGDTPQKCHFTLGFCMLNFSVEGCPQSTKIQYQQSQDIFDMLHIYVYIYVCHNDFPLVTKKLQ